MASKSVLFISTMDSVPWGGSEELWSRTAVKLRAEGFSVAASVVEWSPLHVRLEQLRQRGITVSARPLQPPLWERAIRKLISSRKIGSIALIERCIGKFRPSLAVHSSGTAFPDADFVEVCLSRNIPCVTIGQANHDGWWLPDESVERLRPMMLSARRCYFVSERNLRLAEKQLGCRLANAEIIRNPFNVNYNAAPPWAPLDDGKPVRFATVGRLHPPSKGQDLLFQVLADPVWQSRNWHLRIYGDGPMSGTLERLSHHLGIKDRITFEGHQPNIEAIWEANHVLVMPSRFEGLPLAVVEAMLCGRPVIATDVAGNGEVIEDNRSGFLAEAPTVAALGDAMERFWSRRHEAREIGKEAARRIRQLVPENPTQVFTNKLIGLIEKPTEASPHKRPAEAPEQNVRTKAEAC